MCNYYFFSCRKQYGLADKLFSVWILLCRVFFLLSGFLFMFSFERQKVEWENKLKKTGAFFCKRIKHFYPVYYISLIITLLYRLYIYKFAGGFTYTQLKEYVVCSLPEFFMMNGVFYQDNHTNGPDWYISAMLIAETLWFLIMGFCRNKRQRIYVLMAGSAACLYLYYWQRNLLPVGYNVIRAIGEIGLGMLVYYFYDKTYDKMSNKRGACTVIEILCMICAFWLLFGKSVNFTRAVVIIPFSIWIYVIFCKNTLIDNIISNKFSEFLGKISLHCYLLQMLVLVKFGWNPLFDVSIHPAFSFLLILCVDVFLAIVMELSLVGYRAFKTDKQMERVKK